MTSRPKGWEYEGFGLSTKKYDEEGKSFQELLKLCDVIYGSTLTNTKMIKYD